MPMVKTIIKFDGPAVDGKAMDVADLAPSLVALSDLLKHANRKFNGDKAGLKILVNADLEQNCFELGVELSQTVWDTVSQLVQDEKVRTAKEIAEWIGIIATPAISLYGLIKFLKGKEVENVTTVKQQDGRNNVQIIVKGDSNSVTVNQNVFDLYSDRTAREKAVKVLEPLHKEGYDTVEFYKDDTVFEKFSKNDAPNIDLSDTPEIVSQNVIKSKIRTTARIRIAPYEGKSKWTIVYKKAIQASMDHEEWLQRFQANEVSAPPGSSLEVDLEENVIVNEHGEAIEDPTYRILHVWDVIPEKKQISLFGKQ